MVSRTLGKLGVIDRRNTYEVSPSPGSLWICSITGETSPGLNRGCFLLRPETEIHGSEIVHLPTTMVYSVTADGIVWMQPTAGHGAYWILPLEHKRKLLKQEGVYGVILEYV